MNNPTISPVTPAELPALYALLDRAGLPVAGLNEHTATTLVARMDRQIVGSVGLELYGRAALLRSVAVDAPWRGQGLGSQLVDAALVLANAQGVDQLYLLTETAAPYFARRGFVPIARTGVDPVVTTSIEFTSACPASAQAMCLVLPQVERA
jgi:amino-acid N-acetyltransferase